DPLPDRAVRIRRAGPSAEQRGRIGLLPDHPGHLEGVRGNRAGRLSRQQGRAGCRRVPDLERRRRRFGLGVRRDRRNPLIRRARDPRREKLQCCSIWPVAASTTDTALEHLDVIVVGAGLSGVGAGYHLQTKSPQKSYAILEARDRIGGTWDLFRYPGIRSDSDMYTLGFSFRPWREAKAIADGPSILSYVRDTAREAEINRNIRFRHHVKRADWSSAEARWTVEAERTDSGERVRFTCNWLHMCSGYYNYAEGYLPDFPAMDSFQGRLIHPQFWPEDLDYTGKKVVVIGSGATAVTIVPEMAKDAGHVVMLQRSPTYMVSRPSEDGIANWLRKRLPAKLAYDIVRWKNVLLQLFFFQLARKRPEKVKEKILEGVRDLLPPGYDIATHFTPRYN